MRREYLEVQDLTFYCLFNAVHNQGNIFYIHIICTVFDLWTKTEYTHISLCATFLPFGSNKNVKLWMIYCLQGLHTFDSSMCTVIESGMDTIRVKTECVMKKV